MNSKNLLKILLATLLIFTFLDVRNDDFEKEVANYENQLTCQGAVDINTVAIVPYRCEEIEILALGESSPYLGATHFITPHQIRTIQLYFPYR